ncbi:hypothetical protein [Vibrio brasiliensis]
MQQGQHFIAELDNGITITWTPDGSTDVLTPDTVPPENEHIRFLEWFANNWLKDLSPQGVI